MRQTELRSAHNYKYSMGQQQIERFSYDLEMIMHKQNANNKRTRT